MAFPGRPGGTLSSLGVYSSDLKIPVDAFATGLGDHTIVTTLCPGGKERIGKHGAGCYRQGAVFQEGSARVSHMGTI